MMSCLVNKGATQLKRSHRRNLNHDGGSILELHGDGTKLEEPESQ